MNKPKLTSAHIEITSKCNLRCAYCYNGNNLSQGETDLTESELKRIVVSLLDCGVEHFVFSGGEPFACQHFLPFLSWLYDQAPEVDYRILSNGTLLTENIVSCVQKFKGMREIRISIDGFESEKTRGRGTFSKALNGAKIMVEANIYTGINTVLNKENVSRILEFYRFLKTTGVSIWRIDTPFLCGFAKNNFHEIELSKKIIFPFLKELILENMKDAGKGMQLAVSRLWHSNILKHPGVKFAYHFLDNHPCDYHRHALTVRANGDISFCPSWNRIFGNVKNETIPSVWSRLHSSKFSQLKVADLDCAQNCQYIHFCGGGCRSDVDYTGAKLTTRDERTCQEMNFLFEEIIPLSPPEVRSVYEDALLSEETIIL